MKTNLVFRKGSCSTQPVIDICNIGSKNGIQLSLGIVDNSPSSILNFGSYLKPTFEGQFTEDSEQITFTDIFNNKHNYYQTNTDDFVYYNFKTNLKLKKETETGIYTFFDEDDSSQTVGLTNRINGYFNVVTKFKNKAKYALNSSVITRVNDNIVSTVDGGRAVFVTGSNGLITLIKAYPINFTGNSTDLVETIIFNYVGSTISRILFNHIDGTTDTYEFSFSSTKWMFKHIESSRKLEFNFDSSKKLLSFGEDYISYNRTNFLNIITYNQTNTVISHPNNKFTFIHFSNNGNMDYEFNEKGIIKFIKSNSLRDDSLVEAESDPLILGLNSSYVNLAPSAAIAFISKWKFTKGISTSSYGTTVNNIIPYYSCFYTSLSHNFSIASTDTTAKLSAEVTKNLSNKNILFTALIKVNNSGSASHFKVVFTPYYKNIEQSDVKTKYITIDQLNDYRYICEEVLFNCNVDKMKVEIIFNSGMNINIFNPSIFEQCYGTHYYRDYNNSVYKIVKGKEEIRMKNYSYKLQHIEVGRNNIFLDEVKDGNNYIKNSYISKNFIKSTKRDPNNNVLEEQIIYRNNNEIKQNKVTNEYNSLDLCTKTTSSHEIVTENTYHLNTDLIFESMCLRRKNKYNYQENCCDFEILWKPNPLYNSYDLAYKSHYQFNNIGLITSENEINKSPYMFYYAEGNELDSCTINNIVLEENIYDDSQYLPIRNLIEKIVNNFVFKIAYNSDNKVTSVKNSENVSLFTFSYNNFSLVSNITNSIGEIANYSYDKDLNLINESFDDFSCKKVVENNKIIKSSYDYNNENYHNKFIRSDENINSEIINGILSKMCDHQHYVGLFDRTNDFIKSDDVYYNEVERFCDLISNYYKSNEEAKLFYDTDEYRTPIEREGKGLTFAKIYSAQPISYMKQTLYGGSVFPGSIGCVFNMPTNNNNVCVASVEIGNYYLIKIISTGTSSKTLKIQFLNTQVVGNELLAEFDTSVVTEINKTSYFNLNFILNPSVAKFNFYCMENNYNFVYSGRLQLPRNNVNIKYSFNKFTYGEGLNKVLKIAAVLADFNQNIKLEDVIEYFDCACRAYKLSKSLSNDNAIVTKSNSAFLYPKISENITHFSFKNTLVSNNQNEPLNVIKKISPYGYGGVDLGNTYYAYGQPLLYKTNLGTSGVIIFKSKLLSIGNGWQTYFSLLNEKLKIKLSVTTYGEIKLSVNNNIVDVVNVPNLLTSTHKIKFGYSISNTSFSFNFELNDANLTYRTIYFDQINDTNSIVFDLFFGADDTNTLITDINGGLVKKLHNYLDGFISDFVYYAPSPNVTTSEITNMFKPIISNNLSDGFERKYQDKVIYNGMNIINKRYEYNDSTIEASPFLKNEKVLLGNTVDQISNIYSRKFEYDFVNPNMEGATSYSHLYKYIERIDVNENNSSSAYLNLYYYDLLTDVLTKHIIKKGYYQNNQFISQDETTLEYIYENNCIKKRTKTYNSGAKVNDQYILSSSYPHVITYHNNNSYIYDGLYLKQIKNYMGQLQQTFNYRGSKLIEIVDNANNVSISFDYDYNGRRTKKFNSSNSVTSKYFYDGDLLVKEIRGNTVLNYLYDGNNSLIGFEYFPTENSTKQEYFFLKNSLNDVVEILDKNGNSLVHYVYGAFGEEIEVVDNSSNNLSQINPFRYRGYYYDNETQFYWVSSRYYSPELCRWISPDSIEYLDLKNINGLNLYVYCGNDPINKYDPTGHIAIASLIAFGIGAFLGGIYGGVSAAINGQDVGKGIAIGAVVGGLTGLITDVASVPLMLLGTFAVGAGGDIASQMILDEKSFGEVNLISAAWAGVANAGLALVGKGLSMVDKMAGLTTAESIIFGTMTNSSLLGLGMAINIGISKHASVYTVNDLYNDIFGKYKQLV